MTHPLPPTPRLALIGTASTTQRWASHVAQATQGWATLPLAWVATQAHQPRLQATALQPLPTHGLLTSGQALRYISKPELAALALSVTQWVTTGQTTAEALTLSLGMTGGYPMPKVWQPPNQGCSAHQALRLWQASQPPHFIKQLHTWYWPTTVQASPKAQHQLEAWGQVVHRHNVYTTQALSWPCPTLTQNVAQWQAANPTHVVLFSPSAVRAWRGCVEAGVLALPPQGVISLGESTAEALAEWLPQAVPHAQLPASTPEALVALLS
jgi:uroporphyrinogen-III synthase